MLVSKCSLCVTDSTEKHSSEPNFKQLSRIDLSIEKQRQEKSIIYFLNSHLTLSVSFVSWKPGFQLLMLFSKASHKIKQLDDCLLQATPWLWDKIQRSESLHNLLGLKNNHSGFLLQAGSRVPAPVYFEQCTRLL